MVKNTPKVFYEVEGQLLTRAISPRDYRMHHEGGSEAHQA
jgi:hypothetical protein